MRAWQPWSLGKTTTVCLRSLGSSLKIRQSDTSGNCHNGPSNESQSEKECTQPRMTLGRQRNGSVQTVTSGRTARIWQSAIGRLTEQRCVTRRRRGGHADRCGPFRRAAVARQKQHRAGSSAAPRAPGPHMPPAWAIDVSRDCQRADPVADSGVARRGYGTGRAR